MYSPIVSKQTKVSISTNRFSALEDCVLIDSNVDKASNADSVEHRTTYTAPYRGTATNKPKKKKTVVIGDSMVKGIQTTQIIECCKAKHRGEMFPGATIADMHSNFIKPVLHVGTNDAANRKATEITNDVTICVRK